MTSSIVSFCDSFREKIPFSTFSKRDRQVAFVLTLVALATYWFTAMPNIGLSDDGEMGTAAIHFGVPHPSGYPLWTILAGLFNHLPFGNAAWKLNLFSGLCAALAVGLFGLISRNSARWLGLSSKLATAVSIPSALIFAWSIPVWSQATIGKGTYSLHVLLMIGLTLLSYLWIRNPQWKNAFVWIVFAFSLGMSNHHMTLAMATLPLIVILLLHRDLFWEYTLYSLAIASLIYLGFGVLSSTPAVMSSAYRFCYLMVGAFLLFFFIKKKFPHWRQGILVLLAVILGLLPYLYMPLASSTNPPMNWSYTSTKAGFYYAINRSQYWGTLADQLQGTIGNVVGVPPSKKGVITRIEEGSRLANFRGFSQRFWLNLIKNLTPLSLITFIIALLLAYRRSREERIWLILLFVGFGLAAFFEPIMAPMGYDNLGWDLQKPWQGLCYGFFTLMAGYGVASLIHYWQGRKKESEEISLFSFPPSLQAIVIGLWSLVALYTFSVSLPWSSQRGHWFGWMLGHDMLVDLPLGSVVLGGTDQGRFIPTYMIFGESREKGCFKRDSHFDRRDLYILTQNALADTFYNHYIRAQYTIERPHSFNWIEKLLQRDKVYPKEDLIIPNLDDIIPMYQKEQIRYRANPLPNNNPLQNPAIINADVAQLIFLHNRDQHHFFVEESFPMPWSYAYATPHGLCYELHHDPITEIPKESVVKDKLFWDHYIEKLCHTPGYQYDTAARHTFSKLRNTTGNLYYYRKMLPEAEYAYRQALQLDQGNLETIQNMTKLLVNEHRYQEAVQLLHDALKIDPNCFALQQLSQKVDSVHQIAQETAALQKAFSEQPNNRTLFNNLLKHYWKLSEKKRANQLVDKYLSENPKNLFLLAECINFYAQQKEFARAEKLTQQAETLAPKNWAFPFALAKYQLLQGKQVNAFETLATAIQLGGKRAKEQMLQDPTFAPIRQTITFQELLKN